MAYSAVLWNKWWWILVGLSVAIHLVGLGYPSQVVFDEVHFGKFVNAYCCTRERIFDIHPPHGKLLIAAAARLGGYDGTLSFSHIGQPYGSVPVWALRLVPALAGVVIPLLAYGLLRQVGVSPGLSFLGGLALVFDNGLTLQTRVIALDGLMIAAILGALAVWLAAARLAGEARPTGRGPLAATRLVAAKRAKQAGWRQRWWWLAAGGLAGLAVGVKFTGLVALAVLGVATAYRLVKSGSRSEARVWLTAGGLILIGALVVYLAGWVFHFSLLNQPGSGDVWQVPTGRFVPDLIEVHQKMLRSNYSLGAGHPYTSDWWTWPFMKRPVFYWQGEGGLQYFIGNPVVWWGGTILFVSAILSFLLSFTKSAQAARSYGWLFLVGYLIAYLPLMRVPRVLFLYHYLTPLVLALLFGLWWLDKHVPVRWRGWRDMPAWYGVTLFVLVGGFVLFSPLTYGWAVPSWQALLFWFPGWR